LANCIAHTQGWKPCYDLYREWLQNAGPMDPTNLAARGLANNQKAVIQLARTISSEGTDLRSIPWDGLVGAYRTTKGSTDHITRLLAAVSGPLAELGTKILDGTAGSAAIYLMAASAGKRFTKMTIQGTYQDFLKYLVQSTMDVSGLSAGKAKAAVKAEIERQSINTWRLASKSTKQEWIALMDLEAASTGEFGGTIHSVSELKGLAQSRWKQFTGKGARFAIASGIFQIIGMTKLVKDFTSAMSHEKWDAGARLFAGSLGLAGTFADGVSLILESMPARSISLGALGVRESTVLAKFLEVWGRRLGIAAAVVNGLWDAGKAIQEKLSGHNDMERLYIASALSGTGSAIILCTKLLPCPAWVGWLLLGIFIGVNVWIDHKKNNRVKEWLKRCYWGIGPEQYPNLDFESHELELVFG